MKIELQQGKYMYLFDEVIGSSTAFRNGKIWRDTTGDKLLLAMAQEIIDLREKLDIESKALTCIVNSYVDN